MLPMAKTTTKLVNMRGGNKDYDVKIDRTTRWGNPHFMRDSSDAERERVCYEYGVTLWLAIYRLEIPIQDLADLHGKRLGCWCAPKQCHGQHLIDASAWAHAAIEKWNRIEAKRKKRKRK